MSDQDPVKAVAKQLMRTVIDPAKRTVVTASLRQLDHLLRGLSFLAVGEQSYGPGGRQLFYRQGRVMVRVKTKGDSGGPRAGQAHLSASLTDGRGTDWFNELAKLNYAGDLAAKSMTSADRFQQIDFQGNAQRFVVITGGLYDGPGADAWANRTHFPFPPGFVDDLA